jgi:hypothetical protein
MAFRDTQNPGIGGLDELTLSEETSLQTIAALGAPGEILRTNLAGTAVEWTAAGAGSGDVSKVGTPVNNQVGVWTGDGTIEGDTALTFDTATNTLTAGILNLTADSNQIVLDSDAVGGITTTLTASATGSAKTITFPNATTTLAGLSVANSFTTAQAITPTSDVISLAVRRNGVAQTANILEIQTEANAFLAGIDKVGNPTFGSVGIEGGAGAGDPSIFSTGDGTSFDVIAADGTVLNSDGGGVAIYGGYAEALGNGTGGIVNVNGGTGGATGNGGYVALSAGAGGATSGAGGAVIITAGSATTSGNGGDIKLQPGAGAGAGSTGRVFITSNGTLGAYLDIASIATTAKTFTFPNATGTLALTSDIPSLTGYVNTTGTPANNQIAVFTDADTVEGDAALTFDTATDRLSVGTSGIVEAGTIELGHASDTTLSRSSAGILAVEGVTVPLNSTTNTHTAQQIELGHASDTTLTRASAGVLAVEGNNVILANTTATRTLVLTAAGGVPTTTSGCASPAKVEAGTNDVDYYVLDFDATSTEYAVWNVVMPDNYDGGTVTAKFYWTSAAGGAGGTVVWGLAGRAFADDEAIDQAFGTAQEVSDDWIANGDVHVTSATAAITLGGTPAGGEYVVFRVYRDPGDASDDLTGDARLMAVKIEYGINAYSD